MKKRSLFKVSHSKIQAWLTCRRRYHYRYVEKLRRKRPARPLIAGRIVHDMLDANANGGDAMEVLQEAAKINQKLFAAEREQYGEIVEDLRLIMSGYFEFYDGRDIVYLRRGGQSAEFEFELEIAPGIVLVGKIDGFVKSKNRLKWLIEHKTFTRYPKDEHLWRNIQSAIYLRVNEKLGWFKDVSGTLWDYVWSKPPTIPALLKNGRQLSAAQTDTLPIVIREEIERLELDVTDNDKVLAVAFESAKKYYRRVYTPVKKLAVDLLWNDLVDTAKEMREYHGLRKQRNIQRHCEYCEFEALCRAQLLGHDYDFVLNREYHIADSKEETREGNADA